MANTPAVALARLAAPHADVEVRVEWDCLIASSQDIVRVLYFGTCSALIAAGAATAALVGAGKPGRRRTDSAGDRAHLERRARYVILTRYKTASAALALPGVTADLVEAARRWQAEGEQRWTGSAPPNSAADVQSDALELATALLPRLVNEPSDDPARQLGQLRALLELAATRRGASIVLHPAAAAGASLGAIVARLEALASSESTRSNPRPVLRLVVDNSRRKPG